MFTFSMIVGYYMQTKDQLAKGLLDVELENSLGKQVEGTIQTVIYETEEFQKKIDLIDTELQSFIISNGKLSDKRIELLNKIDQITELHPFIYSNKMLALDNKIERHFDERNVYRNQVLYIQKWIEVIEKLVSDVHAIVHCIESHQSCSKLGYNFEENYTNKVAIKVINLIVKFKKENVELLDILLCNKFEEIKYLQGNANLMNKIKKKMEELNEEVSGFEIYRKIYAPTMTQSSVDHAVATSSDHDTVSAGDIIGIVVGTAVFMIMFIVVVTVFITAVILSIKRRKKYNIIPDKTKLFNSQQHDISGQTHEYMSTDINSWIYESN